MTRLHIFLSCFLWPLTALGLWLLLRLLETVFLSEPLPRVLRDGIVCAGLAGGAVIARRHLRALRAQDAGVDAFYASAASEPARTAEHLQGAEPQVLPAQEELPAIVGMLDTAFDLVLSAPRSSARAAWSARRSMCWDVASCTAAKQVFEALGATGGAWVACSAHPGAGHLMAGLERLGLIEHRHQQISEIRLLPAMRVRYFPKDPSQAMYQAPPRRS